MSQIPSTANLLSPEERQNLMRKNHWKAGFQILIHWAWIIMAFVLVAFYPHPLTVFVALFILGGKQLACSILMHDAGHGSVFSNRRCNDLIGQVLGAWPIFQNMKAYRAYHFIHHQLNGLEEDPDILLTRGYPTSRKSMFRKIVRDLTGITGVRAFTGLLMMHLHYLEYNLGKKIVRVSQKDRSWKDFLKVAVTNLGGPLLVNLIMFLIVAFTFGPWYYLLWIGAYLTTFQFSIRVRSIAEHSVVHDTTNPIQNTRTTYANWFERLLFAPYNVNYHLEHHMLMSVPSYNLPHMHSLIKARGFYEKGILARNYWEVLKMTVRAL